MFTQSVPWLLTIACCSVPTLGQQSQLNDGSVLAAPIGSETAYLVNTEKQVVHTWPCGSGAGNSTYLLEDGSSLCTGKVRNDVFPARGGPGGRIAKIAWDGTAILDYTVLLDYEVSDETELAHHDVEPMPNGNVLLIASENLTRQRAIATGRDLDTLLQGTLWPETIVELKLVGKSDADIVWEFRRADLNAGGRTGGGLFRAPYYPATFPAFRDRNLVALD